MHKVCNGFVQGVGVTPFDELPLNPVYFTEVAIPEIVKIPCQKPDMEDLVSVAVDAEILSTRLVKTAIGTSTEGQVLSGYKLILEVILRQKIKYIAHEPTQSVHAAHFEKGVSSIFIVVPSQIDDESIEDLFEQDRLIVTPYIEDIYGVMRDKRTIFKNITMLVNVTII